MEHYTANNIQACIRLIVDTGVILVDIQIDTDLLGDWFDTTLKILSDADLYAG